jgi:RNA polymerase sigma factor (sigma-70 family)
MPDPELDGEMMSAALPPHDFYASAADVVRLLNWRAATSATWQRMLPGVGGLEDVIYATWVDLVRGNASQATDVKLSTLVLNQAWWSLHRLAQRAQQRAAKRPPAEPLDDYDCARNKRLHSVETTKQDAREQAEMREHISQGLKCLTSRSRYVLRLRFGLEDGRPYTLKEVGDVLGMTREGVRQIEEKAMVQLKRGNTYLHTVYGPRGTSPLY